MGLNPKPYNLWTNISFAYKEALDFTTHPVLDDKLPCFARLAALADNMTGSY